MPTHNRFFNDASGNPSAAALQACGPILNVLVHVPIALAKLYSGTPNPLPTPVAGLALIDTGASNTCVHEPALVTLGLHPVGVVTSRTAAGAAKQQLYPVRLEFPGEGLDLSFSSVAGVDLSGQHLPVGPNGSPVEILVLVGRDVLSNCTLVYNGVGGFFSLHV